MEDLPRTFLQPVPIDNLLNGITRAAVDLIGGAECADVLLVSESNDFRSLAATRQLAIDVDGIQEQLCEGPCLDAADGDALVRCDDLRDDPRWPRFA